MYLNIRIREEEKKKKCQLSFASRQWALARSQYIGSNALLERSSPCTWQSGLNRICLSYRFTDPPGEQTFTYAVFDNRQHLVQHPTYIHVYLGDQPNIRVLFITSHDSTPVRFWFLREGGICNTTALPIGGSEAILAAFPMGWDIFLPQPSACVEHVAEVILYSNVETLSNRVHSTYSWDKIVEGQRKLVLGLQRYNQP